MIEQTFNVDIYDFIVLAAPADIYHLVGTTQMDTVLTTFTITHTAGLTAAQQIISHSFQLNTESWLSVADTTTTACTVSVLTNLASDAGAYDYTLVGSLSDPFNSVNSAPLHIDIITYQL